MMFNKSVFSGDSKLRISEYVREWRIQNDQSQSDLSAKSGVPFSTFRKFEKTGNISLESLLKIAATLGIIDDVLQVFKPKPIRTLKDIKRPGNIRKRAGGKRGSKS